MLWYSFELPQQGNPNEYPQHMLLCQNKKIAYWHYGRVFQKGYSDVREHKYVMKNVRVVPLAHDMPTGPSLHPYQI